MEPMEIDKAADLPAAGRSRPAPPPCGPPPRVPFPPPCGDESSRHSAHSPPEWYLPEARFCSSSSPRSLMRNTEKARCKSGTVWARRLSAVPMGLSNTSTKIRLSSRSVISFLREREKSRVGHGSLKVLLLLPGSFLILLNKQTDCLHSSLAGQGGIVLPRDRRQAFCVPGSSRHSGCSRHGLPPVWRRQHKALRIPSRWRGCRPFSSTPTYIPTWGRPAGGPAHAGP